MATRDRPETIISPSILSSDFSRLAEEVRRMQDCGAEWTHVDVMVRAMRSSSWHSVATMIR